MQLLQLKVDEFININAGFVVLQNIIRSGAKTAHSVRCTETESNFILIAMQLATD